MFNEKIKRAIMDGRVEETEQGLLIPSERTLVQGIVAYGKRGEPEEITHNLIVGQGLNHLVGVVLKGDTQITNWYVALFSGDVTVQGSWTASNFAGNATEWTAYDESTRRAWTGGSVSSGAVDSFSSKASFTASSDGQTVRGAALISGSAKGGTSGVLLGATRFPSSKSLDTGEILDVGYGIQLSAV